MLSFGDGTGYFANTPFPPPGLEKKLRKEHGKVQNKGQPDNKNVKSTGPLPTLDMPASPADFLNTGTPENDEITCHWAGCTGLIPGAPLYVCYNCEPQLRPTTYGVLPVCTQYLAPLVAISTTEAGILV
jgi:hypothetical protein